ncbi:MAG: hypothetical protein A2Y15_08735 [Clostridiales bacterium GWF2_36_10]|nr:MAG: hypothetical protein A2Y15_08735 [Clostridiales bacterium GWF2_36_10]HAN20429.1 hypothetical protein [Clostridiales bacterium]
MIDIARYGTKKYGSAKYGSGGTIIKVTPPGGEQKTIEAFQVCETALSVTDRAGSFRLSLPAFDNSIIDVYPVGSDVTIDQGENIFRGWVIRPPKSLMGVVRTASLEGATYTSRTQKIIVTESYTNVAISDIVLNLFSKYVSWATVTKVQACSKIISINFGDVFLWDAMEQLCRISLYDWYIDETLDVNFFDKISSVNPIVLSQENANYKRGSANFTPDASKLVNKLWVKGGKAVSDPFTQSITISGTTPIPLFYTPRSPITVTIGGVEKTLGIQNITDVGTKDFLINTNEKLLIPDLCTSGTGTIVYCYEYPIKLLLEDKQSQTKYGVFEDILNADTDDKTIARELGIQYLFKYSNPVMTGNIQPMEGKYKPGELIKIEIPDININDYFQIKQVRNSSVPGLGQININLQLETPERDISGILKEFNERLAKLERTIYKNSGTEVTVEQYREYTDSLTMPTITDSSITYVLHQYPICGTGTICNTTLLI